MGALPEEDEEDEDEDKDKDEKGEGGVPTSAIGAGSGARVSPPVPLESGLEGQHVGGAVERRGGAATEPSVSVQAGVAAVEGVIGRGEGAARMEGEDLGGRGVG